MIHQRSLHATVLCFSANVFNIPPPFPFPPFPSSPLPLPFSPLPSPPVPSLLQAAIPAWLVGLSSPICWHGRHTVLQHVRLLQHLGPCARERSSCSLDDIPENTRVFPLAGWRQGQEGKISREQSLWVIEYVFQFDPRTWYDFGSRLDFTPGCAVLAVRDFVAIAWICACCMLLSCS